MPTTKTKKSADAQPELVAPVDHPEWSPRDFLEMDVETQEWARAIIESLVEYQAAIDRPTSHHADERWRLLDALANSLKAVSASVGQLVPERAWTLAEAAEKSAGVWLRDQNYLSDAPPCLRNLTDPFDWISTAWTEFCSDPEIVQTRVMYLETLAQLDRLEGITDGQVCAILASGDPTEDEAEHGPWIQDGVVPIPNRKRLQLARDGKAKTPSTRTTTSRLPNWPAKMPALLLVRQVVEVAD